MKITTFWTIFIKILGIWLVLDSITVIPQFISTLPFLGSNNAYSLLDIGAILGVLLSSIGLFVFILWLFVYKTAWIVEKLQLNQGFEDDTIDLRVPRTTIFSIATIVLGGLLFIDGLPQFCRQLFVFFQQQHIFRENPTSAWVLFYGVKTVLGYLLMSNNQLIVNYLAQKTDPPATDTDTPPIQ